MAGISFRPARLFRSLYVRLFAILVLTGLALNGLVGWGVRRMWSMEGPLQQQLLQNWVVHYRDLILRDIGSPPQVERLVIIKNQLGIDLRVWTPKGEAQSQPGLPSWEQLEAAAFRRTSWDLRLGRWEGRYFLMTTQGDKKVAAFAPQGLQVEANPWAIATLLFAVSIVLLLTYFALRGLLKPLHGLTEASQAWAQGRFDKRVQSSTVSEWKQLADSFNIMAQSIETSIARKDQMLRDISHELRSPLTRMRVALSMTEPSKYREHIEQDLRAMDQLIEGILAAARTQVTPQQMEDTDLNRLCKEVVDQYRLLGVMIELDFAQEIWMEKVDAAAIRRVLQNLLDNGIAYANPATQPLRIHCDSRSKRITVRDHGPGVPREILNQLGTAFFRPDPSRARSSGGHGLGLAICKATMKRHEGDLIFNAPNDGGLEVILQFPVTS